MTTYYIGANNTPSVGEQPDKILTGTSTTSADLEVVILGTKGWKNQTIINALLAIIRKIENGKSGFPSV